MFENILFANVFSIILVFLVSLYLLAKASDILTEQAEKIGLLIGIPAFVVGVTIVAVGTSLPELATSIIAVLKGQPEIVAGNVVGSNIANLMLVLGIVAILSATLKIGWDMMKIDLPLLLGSVILLSFMLWDGVFTWQEAILSILGYVVYVFYTISLRHDKHRSDAEKFTWKIPALLAASAVVLWFSADYAIQAIIAFVQLPIAQSWGLNTSLIAASAVAVGTSLPEVFVSVAAARKKKYEVAIGNIVGSNIVNSFVVMAIPAFIAPLVVTQEILLVGIPFMIAATLLYLVSTQTKEVSRYEGFIFLLVYALFIGILFGLV